MTEEAEKKRTILIVDDTLENVELLEAILISEYNIKTANNGNEALQIAQLAQPDLILLDVMMPEMDGYEVCLALRADDATRRIPVIFVTALLDPGDETRGFEAGGVDYITKPVIGAVVRARVKAHLALKKAHDELDEWNSNLKRRLLQTLSMIRKKTEALMSAEEKGGALHGYVQNIELLSGVFELMEDRFSAHSRAVSELAGDAARKMNLSAEDIGKIRLAGILHDVGTLGTRRNFIDTIEPHMTRADQNEYHTHPVRGQDLFKPLKELHDVGLMIRSHHEAYDGAGFPDKLKGEEIPLGARLLAIADFIDQSANSISSMRADYAIRQANRYAGTLLDPRLIPYFTSITRILYFEG
jgi:putative two-component system response regulator